MSQSLTLRTGTFLGLEVVEPEKYTSVSGFPWTAPTLSARGVLVRTYSCHPSPPATLPTAVYWYKVDAVGTVTALVPLSPGWLSRQTPPCLNALSCDGLSALRVSVKTESD